MLIRLLEVDVYDEGEIHTGEFQAGGGAKREKGTGNTRSKACFAYWGVHHISRAGFL